MFGGLLSGLVKSKHRVDQNKSCDDKSATSGGEPTLTTRAAQCRGDLASSSQKARLQDQDHLRRTWCECPGFRRTSIMGHLTLCDLQGISPRKLNVQPCRPGG